MVFVSAFTWLLVALIEVEEATASAVLSRSCWVLTMTLLWVETGAFRPFVAKRILLASVALVVLGCLLRALSPIIVLVNVGRLVHWISIIAILHICRRRILLFRLVHIVAECLRSHRPLSSKGGLWLIYRT